MRQIAVFVSLFLLLASSTMLHATPSIQIVTDEAEYQSGDTIEVSLGAANEGDPIDVDVYVALIFPNGAMWTWAEEAWHDGLVPYLAGIPLPTPFEFPITPLFYFGVPAGVEGYFQFAAAMTAPGTLDFTCDPSFAPFSISEGTVPAVDLYVDPVDGNDINDGSESRPFRTITYALQIASEETERVRINLAAGTYSLSTNGETFPLVMISNMEIVGPATGYRDPQAVLDAEGGYRLIDCRDIVDAAVQNVMITGAVGSRIRGKNCGAGISIASSVMSIAGCALHGLEAYHGSAMVIEDGSQVSISNSAFSGNSARYSGTVDIYGSSVEISSTVFDDNLTTGEGGGLHLNNSDVVVSDSSFAGNTAQDGGGAVFFTDGMLSDPDNLPTLTIDSTDFTDNSSSEGGAIFTVSVTSPSEGELTVSLSDSSFSGNTATENGGAIAAENALVSVNGGTFTDNSAGGSGGAVIQIGNLEVEFESDYFDVAFEGNTAGGNGGAIANEGIPLNLWYDTWWSNVADGSGGAVANENAPAQIEGATF
ncbi:MAG: DUF1565 domain-containing protein, partial [Candidatus Coatesbacteria bacterium]|nr:DUF1565 domain-containing protein [Candidatus Coatesbacteria bacterium]